MSPGRMSVGGTRAAIVVAEICETDREPFVGDHRRPPIGEEQQPAVMRIVGRADARPM